MFRQEAETAQRHVQEYVQQKHKKEAELYVKVRSVSHDLLTAHSLIQLACSVLQFAAVLNEKKAKAIEWKQKAEQAQESAQKASNEVSFLHLEYKHACERS